MLFIGLAAFTPTVTPHALYLAAQSIPDEDTREAFEKFAHDLAVIQSLPEARP